MKILFALPGLHRHNRGAEVAFISLARECAKAGDTVSLIGSGHENGTNPYRFLHAPSIPRENFERCPTVPPLRNEFAYEELTFVPGLLYRYRPADYDVTLTCSYPFTNWVLRRPTFRGPSPPHVFVTENGDWPAFARNSEYRVFGCDGLVCTNPDFYERNKDRWRCRLIPNGVDTDRFRPGTPRRQEFDLPVAQLIVLMVSALIPSKRVEIAIEAVSQIPDAHLVVAGDGPLRQSIDSRAAELLPSRYTRLLVRPEQMPALYQSADVFLHLSKDEPFGNVYLEAMASGLPVVAHKSPRLRWILGDDEYLVETDDINAIAKQIIHASGVPSITRQNRTKRAAAFSWVKIAGDYRNFFREIVGLGS